MRRPARPQDLRVLGIMSGTSIDGVDYAICRFTENSAELLDFWQVPFPPSLRKQLHQAAAAQANAHDVGQLHHDLGRFYAKAASRRNGKFDLIGLHGQTIYHSPHRTRPATLQIGEPAWLLQECQVPVISNFRAQDLAAGGEGAPLATMFHKHVFARQRQHVAVHNLGGISNVTSLHWRSGALRVLAFDTGPANVLIDMACRRFSSGRKAFDKNGSWARSGKIHEALLERWLQHPFFPKKPPKSTGRELFGETFFAKAVRDFKSARAEDVLATVTEFTARSIALNYQLHLPDLPDEVVLCGGGADNAFLRERILAALNAPVRIRTSSDLGWPQQSIEPAAFALLAWLRWQRLPGNIPETTGAKGPALLGQITG